MVTNLTVTGATAETYLSAWPDGEPQPVVSNLNPGAGETRPILVVVPLGAGGAIDIYNHAGRADVIIDVIGWFR